MFSAHYPLPAASGAVFMQSHIATVCAVIDATGPVFRYDVRRGGPVRLGLGDSVWRGGLVGL